MKKTGIMILGMFFIIQTFAPDYTFATFYGNIYGRVVDEETKQGVPGVWVSINIDERISNQTNEKGEFDFQGLPGGNEYVLTVYVSYKTPPLNRYFKQKYFVLCNLPKGKNPYLNDIILLKGVQIKGEIKLWDGTPVTRHLLRFELVEPDIFDPNLSGWYCETIENGYYESRPLPLNKELLIVATGLMDPVNKISYGRVTQKIKLIEGEIPQSIDIVVPNIPTEIKGRIVAPDGEPLKDIHFKIRYLPPQISAVTDENGIFTSRHLKPGIYNLFVP